MNNTINFYYDNETDSFSLTDESGKKRSASMPDGWSVGLENGRLVISNSLMKNTWSIDDCEIALEDELILNIADAGTITLKYQEESFTDHMIEKLRSSLPENIDIGLNLIDKVNHPHKTGLYLCNKDEYINPIIYIENDYKSYVKGKTLSDSFFAVLKKAEFSLAAPSPFRDIAIISMISDWENAKELLSLKAIGVEKNEALLDTVPHILLEDMAAIFLITFPTEGTFASVTITNHIFKSWGITEEELIEAALKKAPAKNPPVLMTLREAMNECLENMGETDLAITEPIDDTVSFMVLTNDSTHNGASCIFYPGIGDKIDQYFPNGCYILPSSIHEVLLITKDNDPEMLRNMVKDINCTQVAPEERLTDNVYEYDHLTKTIRIA